MMIIQKKDGTWSAESEFDKNVRIGFEIFSEVWICILFLPLTILFYIIGWIVRKFTKE